MRYAAFHLLSMIALLGAGCIEPSVSSLDGAQGPLTEDAPFDDLLGAYEGSERDSWQKPDLILSRLAPLEGLTVADLGAGSGYFSFRLLPEAAKVIAVEVDDRFISLLEERRKELPERDRSRLLIRKGNTSTSGLRPKEADVILIVNTYIYLKDRTKYLQHLKSCLRDSGRIVIIDFVDEPTRIGPPVEIRLSADQVAHELEQAGLNVREMARSDLPYQYVLIAQ